MLYIFEHDIQPRVPRELSVLVNKGLSKDPARRHQSVSEMLDEMQGCLEGRHCIVCPPTFVKRTWTLVRHGVDSRSSWRAGLTMATLFTTPVLAIYGLVQLVLRRDPVMIVVVAGVVLFMMVGSFAAPLQVIARVKKQNRRMGFS